MLVCSISQRPLRRAIAAGLAEAAAANDAATTGFVVFATLVDDPANVLDIVDAYLGEIMLEPASAADTVDAGLFYSVSIAEGVTATDVSDSTISLGATIDEAASAADSPDGTIIAGITPATWDSGTVASVTLSSGNLVATNTGTTSTNQGAHVVFTSGRSSGKFYFEATFTTISGTGGGNYGVGIGTTGSTYTNMGNSATTGDEVFRASSHVWVNGTDTLNIGTGSIPQGTVVSIAADLDNRKIWFRLSTIGTWNNSGTADPATNTGGLTVPSGTMVPFVTFGGSGGTAGQVLTANFGASSFSGSVPSGFTSGWPV